MKICDGVYRFVDTCNVYVLARGEDAVLVDFGSGDVLDHLDEFGVARVSDVLMTHHHRDQGQGLSRAAAAGIRIWVPPTERDLFDDVDTFWRRLEPDNCYDLRQTRFSLLADVPVHDAVPEYRTQCFGNIDITSVPTPGHTLGSVSYLLESGGRRVALTGDLIYGPGQVWSLAATQWTFTGLEGAAATVLSLRQLLDHQPDLFLPSHGAPIEDPASAAALLETRLDALVELRGHAQTPPPAVFAPTTPLGYVDVLRAPFEQLTPHLLLNRSSHASSYVLLSETGGALVIDLGYDLITGLAAARDRAARRPQLAFLKALKRDWGVHRVEVAVPTHYHDDHVAGFNLLRDVEGAEVWAERSVAAVLADPSRWDLPALWYDAIPVDETVSPGDTVRWHEYELTFYPLPGHTLFASAIAISVDGLTVLATGDQQSGGWVDGERTELLNFQYANRFEFDDFTRSAELYRTIGPDLMISGHWVPRRVDRAYLDMLRDRGADLARLHRDLLPLDDVDFGAAGFGARIVPYRSRGDAEVSLTVEARNPLATRADVAVQLVLPDGWSAEPGHASGPVPAHAWTSFGFRVRPAASRRPRRARLAADLTVAGRRFGQHAEAFVDLS